MKKELEEEFEEDLEENEESDDEEEIEEDKESEEESRVKELPISKKPILDINFNNLDFSQFTPSVETISNGSPSLESIESRIDTPGFVSLGNASSQSESNLSASVGETYLTSQGQDSGESGVKYLQSGGETKTNIQRVDMQNIGRDVGGFNVQQPGNLFISSESDFQSRNVEQVGMQPERIDMQNLGRKNPLEREEIKYEDQKKYES